MTHHEPTPECIWAQEHLELARGAPLDTSGADWLRAHLNKCADCREIHSSDERLSTLFRRLAVPTVRSDLADQVRRRARARRRRLATVGACWAASLLALALLWPRPLSDNVNSSRPTVVESSDGMPEARALFADPPVSRLAVLARQQDAYLTLLEQQLRED